VNQFTIFDPSFQNLSDLYSSLSELKGNSKAQVHISLAAIHDQVTVINKWFERFLNDLPRLYFYRHLSTDLNDGRFLGIFSDPAINNSKIDVDSSIEICYTSQLKRAIQTAELLTSCPKTQTPLLNEINYGKADGMTYDELKDRFSEIVVAWNQQKDMCFPDGENMADVKERLEMFIIENIAHSQNKVIGIVTHNVFLRVLLAKLFSVSLIGAYKFQVNHGEKIVCRYWNGNLIPELTNEQRIRFREQYLEWPNH
jgi:broad specificity phosphatase PhoE